MSSPRISTSYKSIEIRPSETFKSSSRENQKSPISSVYYSENSENYPKTSKFFCMTQKPSAVCKKSYSQCKTLLRKLKFVIPFFKNNST